jgi:hypothetical protein
MKLLRPYAVYWLDPAGSRNDSDVEPVPSVTVGFIVDQDEHRIRIASELGWDAQVKELEGREYTAIQRAVIFAIKALPRVYNPQAVFDEARARAGKAAA